MWIFTDFGFFSVVAHRDKPRHLLVRARVRDDLVRLKRQAGAYNGLRIRETPAADYPFRLEIHRETFERILRYELDCLEYDNFKSRVAETQGTDRAHVYLGVWDHLRRWFAPELRREPLATTGLRVRRVAE